MNRSIAYSVAGAALFLAGIFVSADALFRVFGGAVTAMDRDFANGSLLFKASLGALGLYVLILQLLPKQAQARPATPSGPPASREQTAVFLGLAVTAALLRFYNLNHGIWFDEMLTYVNYMPLSAVEIFGSYTDPNNHLLFSILARISLSIFGDSVWAFRLPAVVFGIGGIGALYYFSRRVTTTTISLFAVALMTFSYHHIWFSQNARGYTALLFFALLSSAFLLDALRGNDRSKWVLYGVTAALGVFTHLTMGFVIVSHFLIYAVSQFRKKQSSLLLRLDGLFFGFMPMGLLSILAYALIIPGMLGGSLLESGLQGRTSEWTNPIWALMEVVKSMQVGFANTGVALIAAGVLGVGLIEFARKKSEVIGLLLIPTMFGLILMTSIGYTLFPRFYFFAMGFGVVIIMQGAAATGQYVGRFINLPERLASMAPALFCAGVILASLPSLRYVYYPKQNYAGAIELIENEKRDSDSIVTIGIADFPFNEYYGKNWENVRSIEELDEILSKTSRTWLVYTMPVHAKSAYPEIMTRIEQDYDLVRRFYGTLNGGDIVVSLEKSSITREGETPGE